MSLEIIITGLVGLVSTVVGSIVTSIQTKKKYNTEVESQQLHNANEAFELYKKAMAELMDVKDKKIDCLQKEVDDLRNQVNTLQSQMLKIIKMINVENSPMQIKLDDDE